MVRYGYKACFDSGRMDTGRLPWLKGTPTAVVADTPTRASACETVCSLQLWIRLCAAKALYLSPVSWCENVDASVVCCEALVWEQMVGWEGVCTPGPCSPVEIKFCSEDGMVKPSLCLTPLHCSQLPPRALIPADFSAEQFGGALAALEHVEFLPLCGCALTFCGGHSVEDRALQEGSTVKNGWCIFLRQARYWLRRLCLQRSRSPG